jgi:hypothetical protein
VAAWRWLAGLGLFGVCLLSVLCGVLALVLVGAIAQLARVPQAGEILLTAGCYGFAYTGAIARDFELALTLVGVWLALRRERQDRQDGQVSPPPLASAPTRSALVAGLCLGAATLSNYLAIFVAGAVLLWLVPYPRRWLAATVGVALFLPADLWFFLVQRSSRPAQFPPSPCSAACRGSPNMPPPICSAAYRSTSRAPQAQPLPQAWRLSRFCWRDSPLCDGTASARLAPACRSHSACWRRRWDCWSSA